MTNRYERLKAQRRMQRRIRLVVEERRMSLAARPETHAEPISDPEATIEIPSPAALPEPAEEGGQKTGAASQRCRVAAPSRIFPISTCSSGACASNGSPGP